VPRSRTKRLFIFTLLLASLVSGCAPRREPTPDLEATVDAAIEATMEEAEAAEPAEPQEPSPTAAIEVPPTSEQPSAIPSPTLIMLPTAEPPDRTRIVLYHSYRNRLTKLSGLAFANGIDLTIFERDRGGFLDALSSPDVNAAIYAPSAGATKEDLIQLRELTQRGGRALLFYDEYWTDYNSVLQTEFGVSVAEENVLWGGEDGDILLYAPEMLPSWLSGMTIAAKPEYERALSISAYLIAPLGTPAVAHEVTSAESGKSRIVYYAAEEFSLTFFPSAHEPAPNFNFDPESRYFFEDNSIDLGDNEQAALAMLMYLIAP